MPNQGSHAHKQGDIPIYYGSFHFLFHYPYKPPIYYSSFHLIFHYSNITPIYYQASIMLQHAQRLQESLSAERGPTKTTLGPVFGSLVIVFLLSSLPSPPPNERCYPCSLLACSSEMIASASCLWTFRCV